MRAFRTHAPLAASFGVAAFGLLAVASGAQAAPVAPNPQLPSLFVIGDSTARNNARGARGWGDPFVSYFDAPKINARFLAEMSLDFTRLATEDEIVESRGIRFCPRP